MNDLTDETTLRRLVRPRMRRADRTPRPTEALDFGAVDKHSRAATAKPAHRVAMRMVAPILAAARGAGIPPERLLALAGASPELAARVGTDEHVTLGEYLALWEAAAGASGRPDLALAAATAQSTDSFGAIGFACMTSPNVGGAFARLARYYGVLSTASRWSVVGDAEAAARLHLVFELDAPAAAGVRCAVEFALAQVVHFARLFAARPVQVAEVHLPHRAAGDDAAQRALFRCPVLWEQPRAELVLERETFAVPFAKADPHLLAYFEKQADALAAQHATEEELSARVRRLVIEALPSGPPSLEGVARRLAVSERSLRRRLTDEGTSFQTLLEGTRSELAQRYLRDPRLTVSEIAFLVGFSELSPFQRAFKRWTGMSPREFRASARG